VGYEDSEVDVELEGMMVNEAKTEGDRGVLAKVV